MNLQYIGQYLSYHVQAWHGSIPTHDMYDRARFDDLDLDARSHWVGNSKTISVELFRQLSKQQALKRVTTLGHFFRDRDFANI